MFNWFLGLSCFGFFILLWASFEAKLREISSHSVAIPKSLPKSLKILHLTDIHFSRSDKSLSGFFDRLAKETYDLIVLTGDIFDDETGIVMAKENLVKLKSRLGAYAVFGNHDYYDYHLTDIATMGLRGRRHPETLQPVDLFIKTLEEAGVKLLVNESVRVSFEGKVLAIHGLDDPTTGRGDIEKAMHLYNPEEINLLLTHTIDAFFYIGENEIDLSFSGHSHGGQICLPLIGPLITHTQYGPAYASGIKYLKGAVCCVSKGVNASRFFFLRLFCRPEAIVLNVSSK